MGREFSNGMETYLKSNAYQMTIFPLGSSLRAVVGKHFIFLENVTGTHSY
jgi:hypothetical protein